VVVGCLTVWLCRAAVADETPASSAREMARRVDELLESRLRDEDIEPAPLADNAQFLRRASLDLNGVIPSVSDVLSLAADAQVDPDRRAAWIDRLLSNPRYPTHLAQLWTNMLVPADAQNERFDQVASFTRWLRQRFADNVRYDNIVADLLTTAGSSDRGGAVLFYTAAGLKPEELAANTSRIFLGVQIQCAQCHNHPFDLWKQDDFWSFAAFFARLQTLDGSRPPNVELVDASAGEVRLPGTDQIVAPKYLGAEPPEEDADVNRRRQLAIWVVSRENPYFAGVAVNRVWAYLFGRGLVHPVDDFGKHNPPSHPELLDELTAYFIAHDYDLRALFRALTNTRAYQRTSESEAADASAARRGVDQLASSRPELFGQMQIKTLTPEQLYDSLIKAVRLAAPPTAMAAGAPMPAVDLARAQFIARFNLASRDATEFQAGIPQVLALMNGSLTAMATDPAQSGILVALDAPFFSDDERVEALFLTTLSRLPSGPERAQFAGYVESADDHRTALGDVLWALLNSPEFILNH
ncbi:MAG TPA: DUF1549 and DUF1553 domain-containing protein, partial [Pirellulales bacterium]|nr:DUF1549 and DUF1553 domain-containing protein [Pirellulales bacterium]